jgi:hypothetical protein
MSEVGCLKSDVWSLMSVNHDSLSILHSHLKQDLVLFLGSWFLVLLQLPAICCLLSVNPGSLSIIQLSDVWSLMSEVWCLKSDVRKSRFIVYTSFSSEAGFSPGSWLLVPGSSSVASYLLPVVSETWFIVYFFFKTPILNNRVSSEPMHRPYSLFFVPDSSSNIIILLWSRI